MSGRQEVKFANAYGDVVWAIVPGDLANSGEMVTDTRGPVAHDIRVIDGDDVTVTLVFKNTRMVTNMSDFEPEVHLYENGRVTIGVMAFPYEIALHASEYARVGLSRSLDHLEF